MLNAQMQQAVNANISTPEQQAPVMESPVQEQQQMEVQAPTQQDVQMPQQEIPQVQAFDPNGQFVQPYAAPAQEMPKQEPQVQQVETKATDIQNEVAPAQQEATIPNQEQPTEQPKFARDEELTKLEELIRGPVKSTEAEINPEPASEEENLNYKVKYMEQASRASELEAENYRLKQQLKYTNLELEDNATRYWTLKDRQIELNNSIESLRNKVTPDELVDLSERYKVWAATNTDATSVQLVQSLCGLLTQVTWKDASWIFDDYLATRTNKDIPFTSHSDNSSINNLNNNRPARLSL